MKLWGLLILSLLLTGCGGLGYNWGNYDNALNRHYHNPSNRTDLLTRIENHIDRLEGNAQKVPPGLYAEAGTLYLEQDNSERAAYYYQKEHDAWPESRTLMTSLMTKIKGNSA